MIVEPPESMAGSSRTGIEVYAFDPKVLAERMEASGEWGAGDYARLAAGQYANVQSMPLLARLAREFGFAGRWYVKAFKGRSYLVFKGYPQAAKLSRSWLGRLLGGGARETFKATRYGSHNPTVVQFGLRKALGPNLRGMIRQSCAVGGDVMI